MIIATSPNPEPCSTSSPGAGGRALYATVAVVRSGAGAAQPARPRADTAVVDQGRARDGVAGSHAKAAAAGLGTRRRHGRTPTADGAKQFRSVPAAAGQNDEVGAG